MSVNGRKYSWENISVTLPNGIAIGITDISYNDEKGVEARYGKGAVPRGWGGKRYKASGSMSLDRDEFEIFRKEMKGSVYKADPFPIIVEYMLLSGEEVKDTLPKCMITKQDTSGKEDDDNAGAVKLDFIILAPIKWNGVSAY